MSLTRACGVCGAPAPAPFRAPPPELAPDLDLRPGEPTRSTLAEWVRVCRNCGAAAPDLAALPAACGETVASAAYRAGSPFLRWAMLCPPEERREAYLQAAWAADDADTDATAYRRQAAAAWGEPESAESALRLIDVLRRAGDFDAAMEQCAALAVADENFERILAFQQARIRARDTGRHLISSALRPPARMPHVAHGRAPAHGFWTRMFRRS